MIATATSRARCFRHSRAVWGGLTNYQSNAPQGQPVITQAQTMGMANKPFSLDGASGYMLSRNVITRDLYHRFYENQMQIDGGKNDMFAGWADSGGLVMGYWDASTTQFVEIRAAERAGGQFLPAGVRRLLPQPPISDRGTAASLAELQPRLQRQLLQQRPEQHQQ